MADLDRSQLIYLVALNFGKGLMLRGVNLSNVDMRGLWLANSNLSLAKLNAANLSPGQPGQG